jgi:hypothetical protein
LFAAVCPSIERVHYKSYRALQVINALTHHCIHIKRHYILLPPPPGRASAGVSAADVCPGGSVWFSCSSMARNAPWALQQQHRRAEIPKLAISCMQMEEKKAMPLPDNLLRLAQQLRRQERQLAGRLWLQHRLQQTTMERQNAG